MIYVVKLNIVQKDMLCDKRYAYNQQFAPRQDADGEWYISQEERNDTIYKRYAWLELCPLIEYKPQTFTLPQ